MFICTELIEETGRPPGLIYVSMIVQNLKKKKSKSRISNIFSFSRHKVPS